MKRAISILLALMMVLSLAACGGGSTATNTSAPTEAPAAAETPAPVATEEPTPVYWTIQKTRDEFGDITEDSMTTVLMTISGDFSNTATQSNKLTGFAYVYLIDGVPNISFQLLEYGDIKATYSKSDSISLKVKIGTIKTAYEYNEVIATPPNSDLRVTDTNETIYNALYSGSDVRCVITIGSSQYNFTLFSGNFADIAKEAGIITETYYYRETDDETLYTKAKNYLSAGNYVEATEILSHIAEYKDSQELIYEAACNSSYFDGEHELVEAIFLNSEFTALTNDEIQEIVVGDWYESETAKISYYEDGTTNYKNAERNLDIDGTWIVEDNKLIEQRNYSRFEYTIYHFYKNGYVFYHTVGGFKYYDVKFLNGPME